MIEKLARDPHRNVNARDPTYRRQPKIINIFTHGKTETLTIQHEVSQGLRSAQDHTMRTADAKIMRSEYVFVTDRRG